MTARRSRGEGGLHWDETRQRWIATATLGFDARGKRITRKASGTTNTAAKAKLREAAAECGADCVGEHGEYDVEVDVEGDGAGEGVEGERPDGLGEALFDVHPAGVMLDDLAGEFDVVRSTVYRARGRKVDHTVNTQRD